ncbi:hypothetical protein LZ30DRAFT_213448 [Colletotrichum cereale]|nr:hypothetical protein LZ30DRAFT_213448 [Colletotrichum cereale]
MHLLFYAWSSSCSLLGFLDIARHPSKPNALFVAPLARALCALKLNHSCKCRSSLIARPSHPSAQPFPPSLETVTQHGQSGLPPGKRDPRLPGLLPLLLLLASPSNHVCFTPCTLAPEPA